MTFLIIYQQVPVLCMQMILHFSIQPNLYKQWNHVYKCVNETISWLKSNKLAVNPSKSNSMLIGTRQRIKKSTLNISINDCTVKFTNTFNLLGVIIDNNL